jgi:hypothetical protein
MMGAELDSETSGISFAVTWLSDVENFVAFDCHKMFQVV